MKITSFDIFDTCLLRRCGTIIGFYDVLALRVFNGEVPEWDRSAFAAARKKAEERIWGEKPQLRLREIYEALPFAHTMLKSVSELVEIEIALEQEMLVPSIQAKALVDRCRARGNRIVFISDMYLPDDFIRGELSAFGFYKEGDGLYVSSTCGCTKQSGELFKYVFLKEKVPYGKWHHYGDSEFNDVHMPSSLGIKSTLFVNNYTPYQKYWIEYDYSGHFDYPSILAGISRAMSHSEFSSQDRYCDFVTDLIAPFYCSFVYNVLKDAYGRGINNLFFCARDAYQIYYIAEQMSSSFPGLNIHYLYISRDSLYSGNAEARIAYFEQIGLARQDGAAAIVDITTSGKTIQELNRFLTDNGYNKVFGYFFLLWDDIRNIPVDRNVCSFEVEAQNIRKQLIGHHFLNHLYIFENFFAINAQLRTVDYTIEKGVAVPVFDNSLTELETFLREEQSKDSKYFTSLLTAYAEEYISTGVCRYSEEILHRLAIPTLSSFFRIPELHYLSALENFMVYSYKTKTHIPYVVRSPKVLMKLNSASAVWWTASALWSLPRFLRPLYRHRLKNILY